MEASKVSALTPKESRELNSLKRKSSMPTAKNYVLIMIALIAIIYIVDEVTSNIGSNMQPFIINNFFVSQGVDYNEGLATLTYLSAPGSFLIFILPFYKALADRYGRKTFLVLNTIGMGLSMFVCMIAPNIYIYVLGTLITRFFIPNDMQVMYIMEVAPEKHRAKIASITKSIGYIGVTLVPILMRTVMNNDESLWRNVYMFPIILAVTVSIISYIFFKETPVFLAKRISYLENKSSMIAEAVNVKAETQKTGVWQAVKFIVKHKQIKYNVIACMLFSLFAGVAGYLASILITSGLSTEEFTEALLYFPIFNAIITFFTGFLSDALGRKKSALTLGILCVTSLCLLIYGASSGFSPMILGALVGIFTAFLWGTNDLIFIILPTESTPTNIRASVLGTLSLVFSLGYMLSGIIIATLLGFVGTISTACLTMAVLFVPAVLIIIAFKLKETKGNDLETITGAEWD